MDLERSLRAHGCRVTTARRVVWDVLEDADSHLNAATVSARVKLVDPAINQSSVYRALALFTEIGLLRESRTDDTTTWEPFHDDAAIHLVCSSCGRVIHHDTSLVPRLRRDLDELSDFVPETIDVRVSGRCAACPTS